MNLSGWFKGLKGKLLLSGLLPIIGLSVMAVVASINFGKLGDHLEEAYTELIPNFDAIGAMNAQRSRISYFAFASMLTKDEPKERDVFVQKLDKAIDLFRKAQNTYEASSFSEGEAKSYELVKTHKARFTELTDLISAEVKKGTPEGDKLVRSLVSGGEWHMLAQEIQDHLDKSMAEYREQAKDSNKEQEELRVVASEILYSTLAICGLSVLVTLLIIAHKVSKTVGGIANQLNETGHQVSAAITQLTSAGQTLSQSATESAASLEETVASLEEMSSMIKMNSDNAKQAASLSETSKHAAEEGQREITTLISSMSEISKSSKKIEEIIAVIDDIAFQTNLLALNAAVEAARAGEQGKGFAVVAEAVRSLAQRSSVAAKDINNLIKDSVEKVEQGSSIADRSGAVLNNIVMSVKKVSDLNSEISAASAEQTTGIQQITKAMNQLDQGTQANAASSEEIAASSEEISAQTEQLQKLNVELGNVVLGSSSKNGMAEASTPKTSKKGELKAVPVSSKKEAQKYKPQVKLQAKSNFKQQKENSADIIPFDDDFDGSGRKVGNTDGF